jgi:hypothetical protein
VDLKDLQEGSKERTSANSSSWALRMRRGKQNKDDPVGLAIPPGENDDALATTISKRTIVTFNYIYNVLNFYFRKCFTRKLKNPEEPLQRNDSWLLFFVSFMFTTLAASFPVLAILALYKTQVDGISKGWQIGTIGFFAATCAAVLSLARAKRTDVFLATSA